MRRFLFVGVALGMLASSEGSTAFAQTLPHSLQGGSAAVAVAPRLQFTPQELAFAEAVAGNPDLAAFYGKNGLKPVFMGAENANLRKAVRAAVAGMPAHGIPSGRYRPETLTANADTVAAELAYARQLALMIRDLTGGMVRPSRADSQIHRDPKRPDIADEMRAFLAHSDPESYLAGLGPQMQAYRQLQTALQKRTRLIAPANMAKAPEALWRVGMEGEGVKAIRQRLASIGFNATTSSDPNLYDEPLAKAVFAYQEAAGLYPDGVAGPNTIKRLNSSGLDANTRRILVALERLRWMGGEDFDARYVWVNIPEYSARIFDGGHEVFQTRVVVGKSDQAMRTPEFSDQMEYVVVNPRWNVPRSITVKEYLPRLKANRHSVSHIDIVDRRGNVISRDAIDFSKYTESNFPYRMRQKPSDDNALGLVKFIFPNRWNIYLHDTPTKHLFANSERAYSHGCVRIGDPFDLAYQLLSQETSNPQAMFQRALDSGKERYLHLTPNVPVHLVYFTAYPDENGQIRYYSDVYGRDAAVWSEIEKVSLDLGA